LGKTKGKIGCHAGKVESERPPLRSFDGSELAVPAGGDHVGKWAMTVQQRGGHSLVLIFDKYFTSSLRIAVSAFLSRHTSPRGIGSDGECQMNPIKVGQSERPRASCVTN
jgi:hypothetical protein